MIDLPRYNIVHLSGDFPDPVDPDKTPVVKNYIDLTSDRFDHTVFSINRVSPPPSKVLKQLASRRLMKINAERFAYGKALTYEAPAKGVLHKTMLEDLGDWLAEQIADLGSTPKLLVGHKLTIEGIAVERAAAQLGIPFAITLQTHTDEKILRVRPDLQPLFARIYHGATLVSAFSPVAQINIEAKLGRRAGPISIIPCPTDLDSPLTPKTNGDDLLSVFHLKNLRIKNLKGMAKGLELANQNAAKLTLDVVGGGQPSEVLACQKITKNIDEIRLSGVLDRDGVRQRMNNAKAFIMPSLSESFGLVFIEALFAGIPIIYPAGKAVDGYFSNHDFAIPVDPKDHKAIADAMAYAWNNEKALKKSLAHWQASKDANRFKRAQIAADYREAITSLF